MLSLSRAVNADVSHCLRRSNTVVIIKGREPSLRVCQSEAGRRANKSEFYHASSPACEVLGENLRAAAST